MATTREDRLFIALQKCAGALEVIAQCEPAYGDTPVKFTGDYADLGTITVSQILDEANEVLGEETE